MNPYRSWLKDYCIVKGNYSKSDIEEMEIDEYDFIFMLSIAKKSETNGI